MLSLICFTNFSTNFSKFEQLKKKKKILELILDSFFSQFASWKRNHNKNLLKKFVDLKFEIGGTIWWIRNWFWCEVFGFWLMQWNKPLTQKDTACKYGGFSTTSRYPGQQGALQMSTDPTLFQPAMQHSNWNFLYVFSSYSYIYIYNFDFIFFA